MKVTQIRVEMGATIPTAKQYSSIRPSVSMVVDLDEGDDYRVVERTMEKAIRWSFLRMAAQLMSDESRLVEDPADFLEEYFDKHRVMPKVKATKTTKK